MFVFSFMWLPIIEFYFWFNLDQILSDVSKKFGNFSSSILFGLMIDMTNETINIVGRMQFMILSLSKSVSDMHHSTAHDNSRSVRFWESDRVFVIVVKQVDNKLYKMLPKMY